MLITKYLGSCLHRVRGVDSTLRFSCASRVRSGYESARSWDLLLQKTLEKVTHPVLSPGFGIIDDNSPQTKPTFFEAERRGVVWCEKALAVVEIRGSTFRTELICVPFPFPVRRTPFGRNLNIVLQNDDK